MQYKTSSHASMDLASAEPVEASERPPFFLLQAILVGQACVVARPGRPGRLHHYLRAARPVSMYASFASMGPKVCTGPHGWLVTAHSVLMGTHVFERIAPSHACRRGFGARATATLQRHTLPHTPCKHGLMMLPPRTWDTPTCGSTFHCAACSRRTTARCHRWPCACCCTPW